MKSIKIGNRLVGPGHPCFIIAEMSANHNQNFREAVKLIEAAAEAGADAIKLQTYTADSLTIDVDTKWFKAKGEGIPKAWKGKTLYQLYQKGTMPWEWQPKLKKIADTCGIMLFSTPFEEKAVDFLEQMEVPCHKIASYEMTHIPLLKKVAKTKKPVIISRGMASLEDIKLALKTLRDNGTKDIILLHCISSYPAKPEYVNLLTIPDIQKRFRVISGFSDHTIGIEIPIAAVALGASVIEKHFALRRSEEGLDESFSTTPGELEAMVRGIREVEKARGKVYYGPSGPREYIERGARRSLFVVADIQKGNTFTKENIRVIRPGDGLHPKYFDTILGKRTTRAIKRGTPLSWSMTRTYHHARRSSE